jgi:hypothetical protein
MAARRKYRGDMASRWRRRTTCVLIAEAPVPAALREISGTGAFLETAARPELHHPEAGAIRATVSGLAPDGIRIGFSFGEASVAFALAAIAADMSRPSVI